MELVHKSVMLREAVSALAPRPGGLYLDGTLGLGGHARAILESVPRCHLCGLDQDAEALALARERLGPLAERAHLWHLRFADFDQALDELGWARIDGALLDLGVSSLQLDTAERGFSFRARGPLDMRMDRSSGAPNALQFVNRASHASLSHCLAELGEEPLAARIARHIVEARQREPIADTERLAAVIAAAYPAARRRAARRHPATRAFQALRMHVNDELGQLKSFLEKIFSRLAAGARIVIISFHSLEDRMVKRAFRARALPPDKADIRLLYKKPLTPNAAETAANPRAASAKLRAAETLVEIA